MTILLASGAIAALIEWYAVATHRRAWEYGAKPAVLVLLIAWFLATIPRPWETQGIVFAVALLLSLVGDVLLILPGDKFVQGLTAFLLAHIAYIVVFNWDGPSWSARSVILALALGVIAVLLLRRLRAALLEKGRQRMVPALALYAAVLAAMLWSTLTVGHHPAWSGIPAACLAMGGALFYLSDVGIAWNLFVQRLPGDRLLTMIAYHLAQFALAYATSLRLAQG